MNRSLLALATSILVAGTLGVSCADNEPDDSTPVIMGGNGGTGGTSETGGTDSGTGGEGLGGDGPVACAPSQTVCDAFCASTGSDPLNCGTCDKECGVGEGCLAGECEDFGCSTGQVICDEACTNLQADRMHCGTCETECDQGEVCDSGLCATSCAGGRIECDGGCIDPMTDRMHCGADACDSAVGGAGGAGSGVVCAEGEVCTAGSCTTSCPAGQIVCDNRCVDVSNNRDFCGATDCSAPATSGEQCDSGEVCGAGICTTSCPSSQIVCDDRCVDPKTDRIFCGASDCEGGTGSGDGEACGAATICSEGACVDSCPTGFLVCNDKCIDPSINRNFCGATDCGAAATDGDACAQGEICSSGVCEISCPFGQISCGDKCVDPETDRNFCGATTNCEGANDGDVCGGGEYCVDGDCDPTCPLDYVVCGGKCVDPLGNDEFCGATDCSSVMTSGETCSTEESCVVGECRAFLFEWKAGEQVNLEGTSVGNGQVVGTDSLGNTLLLYKQFTDPNDLDTLGLYSRRYDFTTRTWSAPVRIDAGGKQVRNHRIAVAANGNAYAVWDTTNEIYGAAYLASAKTWGPAARMDSAAAGIVAYAPSVDIDGAGNAWVAWTQEQIAGDILSNRIFRRYFDQSSSSFPASPELVTGYPGEVVGEPSFVPVVQMNPNGDVAMIWSDYQFNSVNKNYFGRAYVAVKKVGSTWEQGTQISTTGKLVVGYGYPDLGMDDTGRIFAVWNEFAANSSFFYVRVAKYDGVTWGTPVNITDPLVSQRMRNPRIATGPAGNSVLTFWQGDHGTESGNDAVKGPWPVYAARMDPDLNFTLRLLRTVPARNILKNTQAGIAPRVVLDGLGNSHVLWINDEDIETARYDAQVGGWGGFQVLASGTVSPGLLPVMSVAPGGRAFATWYQGGKILFARFD